jgi:hypothetical protein
MHWRLRWALWSTTRKVLRRGGDFKRAESSPRATALTDLWFRSWPGFSPGREGVILPKVDYSDRYLRLHSLHLSKRYGDTPAEAEEILHRHEVVLSQLLSDTSDGKVVVVGCDWGVNDIAGGWTRKGLPGRWPWIRWLDLQDEDLAAPEYFWGSSVDTLDALRPLLHAVANEKATITISDTDMRWLYIPYDGGADIYMPTSPERDALREAHREWLPVPREK